MAREPILPIKTKVLTWFFSSLVAICSCNPQQAIESNRKGNSPPVISSVTILPEKPTKGSELTLSIQSKDPDGDPMTYQCQWIRNEEEITGEKNNSLKTENLKKGDLIRVRVTPSDGKASGTPFLSPPVKIFNSEPVIQEVWIEPRVAYVTDILKANVKASDPDGDFIYPTYQWERNGSILSDETGEILKKGRLKKGDSIAVIVTPDDREILGTPKKSEPIIISNSAPLIVSSPPASVEKTTYVYQVKANDPDNDPLTFILKSGPKGMEMDKKTGLITWEIRKEGKGSHPVEIEVSDVEGAKSFQRYTLTIDFK